MANHSSSKTYIKKGRMQIQLSSLTPELTFTPQFIQHIHATLEHIGHSSLAHWFLKRKLKALIKLLKQYQDTHTFKSLIPPRLTKAFMPNQVLQTEFIGPLHVPFADKYIYLHYC